MLRRIALLALSLVLPFTLHAQKFSGQVGVGFTAANPDFGSSVIKGVAFYGTFDIGKHLGVTGEINNLRFFTPQDIGEATYLYGPRYQWTHKRLHPYAKFLFGLGSFQYQKGFYASTTTLKYPAYVLGGGADFDLPHHFNARLFDLEYQFLPGFSPHGLNPFAGTSGLAYRF